MFGLKAPNLNPNLLIINKNLKFILSKILSKIFIVATLLLNHINVAFQFTLVRLNLSVSFSKHKIYEYTNVIFSAIIHLF